MVRSKRWLIGYTFHHQKSYVVPTLGQPYQPNGWVAHVGPTWDERWHANCDVRPTMPTMYQRWINVLLLTGQFLREWHPIHNQVVKWCPKWLHGRVFHHYVLCHFSITANRPRVCRWVSDCCLTQNWAIYIWAILWREQVTFDEIIMMSALY
jgi:hypothetical protein